jgi:hypothetical protein
MAVTLTITVTDEQATYAFSTAQRLSPSVTQQQVRTELELHAKAAVRAKVQQWAIDADRADTEAEVAALFTEGGN